MRVLFTFFFSLLVLNVNAQQWSSVAFTEWYESFESPSDVNRDHFFIDTLNYHHNVWQMGKPAKAVFNSSRSVPNAIVTDTLNPYPINDTSVFVVKALKNKLYPNMFFRLHFYYKLDIDSGEIARVEVSGDSGHHWINVMTDDTTYDFTWVPKKPRLDTSSHSWTEFYLFMDDWPSRFLPTGKTYPSYASADTFLYRFTFISDGTQTNKDGWIIDDFDFEDWIEGIGKLQNNNLISIYPNPSNGNIYLKQNSTNYTKPFIGITNLQGVEVYKTDKLPANGYLHLSLPDGVYVLKYLVDDEYAVKRLVIKN